MTWHASLIDNGYAVLPGLFSAARTEHILAQLEKAFADDKTGSTLRGQNGSIYGARNLLQLWPGVGQCWRQQPLPEILAQVLGPGFGLVRVLYFDKPPEQSWALPWHKDLTIAVRNNRLPSGHFGKPTFKAGVPHLEAPRWLLEKMLTVRWHLDDVTEENGPLQVLPGSHVDGHLSEIKPTSILGRRGDVLLMRPLLTHGSNKSRPNTERHRRILHFEFAGVKELPDGFVWHDFCS